MRSTARSTLALFAIVAATAIVGVAHAAESRTATTAAAPRPTGKVVEAGRWFGFGNHKNFRPTTVTPVTTVTKTCVSPVISATTGAVMASCDASTPTTLSRGWHPHHHFNIKHAKPAKLQKKTCCDGYVCKATTPLTAQLTGLVVVSGTTVITTSTPSPYIDSLNNNGECCVPEEFDVTKLLCTTDGYTAPATTGAPGTCASGQPFVPADVAAFAATVNELACLCCSGVIGVYFSTPTNPTTPAAYVCNFVTGADVLGECAA
jgi:hypothetical protein